MDYILKKNNLIIKKSFFLLFFIIIGIWTLPWPLHIPASGLDPSYGIGLNMAVLNHLQFGPDIAFTFGPLGFLYGPQYIDHTLWTINITFNLFIHFFLIFCIAFLMINSNASWKEYFAALPILLISIHFILDYGLLLATTILLYLIVTNKINSRHEIYLLTFISLLLAIGSLIKFNMAMASFGLIIIFLFICFLNKKIKNYVYIIFLYIFFTIILWKIAGQHLVNLPLYFYNSYQISTGYSDAMATNGPDREVLIGLISIIFTIVLFFYSVIKKNYKLYTFILLNSILLFLAFKHGFVRHDMHALGFFSTYSIFLISIYYIYKKDSNFILRSLTLLLSIFLVISIYWSVPGILGHNILQKTQAYELSFSLITNESFQIQELKGFKNKIRNDYSLDNTTIQYLNNKTVDIFPWDIALVWAYDFNWSPRPVFQSYTAYTTYLDKMNAGHFSTKNAPEAILYAHKSIDGRYPIFEEPSTFAAILNNYTLLNKSGEFLLLSYTPLKNKQIIEEDLGTIKAYPGQSITIPKYQAGYVFGRIDLEYSTYGKFMKFFYKPAQARTMFRFSDQTYSNDFRFINGASKNGVFLSKYISNIDDLASVFSENITQDITEMIIDVDNPSHYKKYIQVRFIGVPANITVHSQDYLPYPDYPIPVWHELKQIQGGMMYIDEIVNKQHSQEKVLILDKAITSISINGWAVDDLDKDGTVQTYIILNDSKEEITLTTKKIIRHDVARYFGIESYEKSGWKSTIRPIELKEKCYKVITRILRTNGKEYYELDSGKSICFN